jgi:hypothetical protein
MGIVWVISIGWVRSALVNGAVAVGAWRKWLGFADLARVVAVPHLYVIIETEKNTKIVIKNLT